MRLILEILRYVNHVIKKITKSWKYSMFRYHCNVSITLFSPGDAIWVSDTSLQWFNLLGVTTKSMLFKLIIQNSSKCIRSWFHMNATKPNLWEVNIGSGNGLVPSGTKPLTERMLTQISVATWRHWALLRPSYAIWLHKSSSHWLTHWGRDKMATISRQHFQMHFPEWKCINFD